MRKTIASLTRWQIFHNVLCTTRFLLNIVIAPVLENVPCTIKIDKNTHKIEPPEETKGMVGRQSVFILVEKI